MLGSEPTPTGYVTEVSERLHHYCRTSSNLKKLLPSVEKNLPKIQKSKFSKIPMLGSEPTPTGYVAEVSERLHHYCRTSSNLKKLLTTMTTTTTTKTTTTTTSRYCKSSPPGGFATQWS